MSQILYYQINTYRPNRRYHISYHTGQSTTEKPKLRKFTIDNWRNIGESTIARIPLYGSFVDNISDDIGKINFDGFELNLKNMEIDKKYIISYDDSHYEAYKNKNNELVISEIG